MIVVPVAFGRDGGIPRLLLYFFGGGRQPGADGIAEAVEPGALSTAFSRIVASLGGIAATYINCQQPIFAIKLYSVLLFAVRLPVAVSDWRRHEMSEDKVEIKNIISAAFERFRNGRHGAGQDEVVDARVPISGTKVDWRDFSWSYEIGNANVSTSDELYRVEIIYHWWKDIRYYMAGIYNRTDVVDGSASVIALVDLTGSRRLLVLGGTIQAIGGDGPVAEFVMNAVRSMNGERI